MSLLHGTFEDFIFGRNGESFIQLGEDERILTSYPASILQEE